MTESRDAGRRYGVSWLPPRQRVAVRRSLRWLVPLLRDRLAPAQELRAQALVVVSTLVGIPLLAYYGLADGSRIVRVVLLFGLASLPVWVFVSRLPGYSTIAARASVAVLVCCLFAALYFRFDSSGFDLLLIVPVACAFGFGRREAFAWSVVVLTGAAAMELSRSGPGYGLWRNADFFGAYVVVVAVIFVHASLQARDRRLASARISHSSRRQAREIEELRRSRDRMRRFSRLASDWLYELDAELRIVHLSRGFEKATGVPVGALIGRHVSELVQSGSDSGQWSLVDLMRRRQPFVDAQHPCLADDGRLVHVLTRGDPMFGEDGSFAGYLCSAPDITPYVLAQAEERSRTRAVGVARKLDAMRRVTNDLAHDLNNLFAVISGNLELLHLQAVEDTREVIDDIRSATQDVGDLTGRLLAFSRVRPNAAGPVSIDELLREFAPVISRMIGPSVQLEMAVGSDVGRACVDQDMLQNALLNLAVNSRDAMEGESGHITIRAESRFVTGDPLLKPAEYIVLSVSDDGTGIPDDILDSVIDPFFTTKPEASGLGLSGVYGFVSQSGGRMEIQSKPGDGTCVTLYLPRFTDTADASQDERPLSVMMVEDEANVQQIVDRMLGLLGHDTTVFSTAEDALSHLDRMHPDLVLTDVMLGSGMNGVEFAELVSERRPDTPVILMSAYSDALKGRDRDRAFDLLRKPFGYQELREAIRRVVVSPNRKLANA